MSASDVSPESEFEERRKQTFWERLDDVGEVCNDRHKRLRVRLDQMEAQLDAHAADLAKNTAKITALEGPVEATRVRFTPGVILTAIAITAATLGGGYTIRSGITTSIGDLKSSLDSQSAQQKIERAASDKLQDERYLMMTKSLDAVSKKQELQALQIGKLSDDITKLSARR